MTGPILVMDYNSEIESVIEEVYYENKLPKGVDFYFYKSDYDETNKILKKFFNKKRYMNVILSDKNYFNYYRVMRNIFILKYLVENPGVTNFFSLASYPYRDREDLPKGINTSNKFTIEMSNILNNVFSENKTEKYANFINFSKLNNILNSKFVKFIYQYCVCSKYFDVRFSRKIYLNRKVPEMFLVRLFLRLGFVRVNNDFSELDNEINQLNMFLKFKNIDISYNIVRPDNAEYNIINNFLKFHQELNNIIACIRERMMYDSDFMVYSAAFSDEAFSEDKLFELNQKYFGNRDFFNMLVMKNKILKNSDFDMDDIFMFMLFYKANKYNNFNILRAYTRFD